ERRIQVIEMRCVQRLLGIFYKYHITHREVLNRSMDAIGPTKNHLEKTKTNSLPRQSYQRGRPTKQWGRMDRDADERNGESWLLDHRTTSIFDRERFIYVRKYPSRQ
ncbi:hypothetical protein DPMN_124231, partial [Dreissena polymorpha]